MSQMTYRPSEQQYGTAQFFEERRLGGWTQHEQLLSNRMSQTCDMRDPRCSPALAKDVNNFIIESAWVRPSMYDTITEGIQSIGQQKYADRVTSKLAMCPVGQQVVMRPQMPSWRQVAENPTVSLETSDATASLDRLRAAVPVPTGLTLTRIPPVQQDAWRYSC